MAIIVRLEGEVPPLVVPPYAMDGETTVGEALLAACRLFKRNVNESKLVSYESGEELSEATRKLKDYGVGHWSMLTLVSSVDKQYKRVTFGT
jgi:hypothetical protein